MRLTVRYLNGKVAFTATPYQASAAKSVAAAGTSRFDIDISKSGYTPLGVVGYDLQYGGLQVVNIGLSSASVATIWLYNATNTAISPRPSVIVLYRPN